MSTIALASRQKLERHGERAGDLIGDATNVPVLASAILARDRHEITHLAVEYERLLPIDRHLFDELEGPGEPGIIFR